MGVNEMTDEKILNEYCEKECKDFLQCGYSNKKHCPFRKGIEYGLAETKAEIKQIIERERVVPEHYLIEMIEKNKELKSDLEESRKHCKAVDEVNAKMKRCANCKHYFLNVCRFSDKKQKVCKTQVYKYWELKE